MIKEYDEAITYYKKTLKYCSTNKDLIKIKALVLGNIAEIYFEKGNVK